MAALKRRRAPVRSPVWGATRKRRVQWERPEQIQIADYLDLVGVLWTHPPLGGRRPSKAEAALLHACGARAGVPDVLIFDPPPHLPDRVGCAFELKATGRGGRPTEAQRMWLKRLEARRWCCFVANGFEHALSELQTLGYRPGGGWTWD